MDCAARQEYNIMYVDLASQAASCRPYSTVVVRHTRTNLRSKCGGRVFDPPWGH